MITGSLCTVQQQQKNEMTTVIFQKTLAGLDWSLVFKKHQSIFLYLLRRILFFQKNIFVFSWKKHTLSCITQYVGRDFLFTTLNTKPKYNKNWTHFKRILYSKNQNYQKLSKESYSPSLIFLRTNLKFSTEVM